MTAPRRRTRIQLKKLLLAKYKSDQNDCTKRLTQIIGKLTSPKTKRDINTPKNIAVMKAVSLLSGGIDSPVATILGLKKGIEVHAIHFSPETLSKKAKEEKMTQLAKAIQTQGNFHFYICPFKEIQKSIIAYVPSKLRMIIYRRLMFRIGERLLKEIDGKAFITGDSLGQVASQTTENIRTIYSATKHTKFTPLLGKNKQEIIDLAKEFMTYEISIKPYEDCCSFMIASHPELRSTPEQIEKIEKEIPDYEELIKRAEIGRIF